MAGHDGMQIRGKTSNKIAIAIAARKEEQWKKFQIGCRLRIEEPLTGPEPT